MDVQLTGWVGDPPDKLHVCMYTDADFAGDPDNYCSTSGVFLCLRGPNSFVPLSAGSKRQTCVSHSTPEAEIVAADYGLRAEGLPALSMWEVLLGKKVQLQWMEDNSAALKNYFLREKPNYTTYGSNTSRRSNVPSFMKHQTGPG